MAILVLIRCWCAACWADPGSGVLRALTGWVVPTGSLQAQQRDGQSPEDLGSSFPTHFHGNEGFQLLWQSGSSVAAPMIPPLPMRSRNQHPQSLHGAFWVLPPCWEPPSCSSSARNGSKKHSPLPESRSLPSPRQGSPAKDNAVVRCRVGFRSCQPLGECMAGDTAPSRRSAVDGAGRGARSILHPRHRALSPAEPGDLSVEGGEPRSPPSPPAMTPAIRNATSNAVRRPPTNKSPRDKRPHW